MTPMFADGILQPPHRFGHDRIHTIGGGHSEMPDPYVVLGAFYEDFSANPIVRQRMRHPRETAPQRPHAEAGIVREGFERQILTVFSSLAIFIDLALGSITLGEPAACANDPPSRPRRTLSAPLTLKQLRQSVASSSTGHTLWRSHRCRDPQVTALLQVDVRPSWSSMV